MRQKNFDLEKYTPTLFYLIVTKLVEVMCNESAVTFVEGVEMKRG